MDSPSPVLTQISLVVSDMSATVDFYRRLGLTIPDVEGEWAEWAMHHRSAITDGGVDFEFDSQAFTLKWNPNWRPAAGGRAVIGFRLPSREAVDALYESLTAAGSPGEQPPFDAFWGARYAVVSDPDGNPVGLTSPRDPAMSRPAPLP
jgi:uncharacterized glyoxalase superfamily protein PhnB